MFNYLKLIDHAITSPLPAAPYIPYVLFPVTTFLCGPSVACYSAGMADLVSLLSVENSGTYKCNANNSIGMSPATRETAGCYVWVKYLFLNSNGVTNINNSTMVVMYMYCMLICVSALIVFG